MRVLRQDGTDTRPVLVTGGCGFIGSNLTDALVTRGSPVIALDSLAREGSRENAQWLKSRHGAKVDIRRGDIRDAELVRGCVSESRAVLHLAGQVAVTTSLDDPIGDFEVNARGTLNVLEAIRTVNHTAPLLFASTNKVYGQVLGPGDVRREHERYVPADNALDCGVAEDAPLDFHSPYGCSKGAADQYVRDYARVYGLRTAVLRMSCIYGPRQFGTEDQGWVAHFLIRSLRGEPITIFGDGYQVRDVLHVHDAVAAWLAVLGDAAALGGDVFNLGGGPANAVSLRELLHRMAAMGRHAAAVIYSDWRPGDQPWYISDTSALHRALGWAPRVDLAEGLGSLEAWLASRFSAKEMAPAAAIGAVR